MELDALSLSRYPNPTAGSRAGSWCSPESGLSAPPRSPVPRAFPVPPAGAVRALRDPLLGAEPLLSAATCSSGSFFLHFSEKQLFSAPSRVFYLSEPNAHVSGAEVVSFSERCRVCFRCRLPAPPALVARDRRGAQGWLGCPCPRPGAELRPQMRHDFTFGLVFPEHHWNHRCPGAGSFLLMARRSAAGPRSQPRRGTAASPL